MAQLYKSCLAAAIKILQAEVSGVVEKVYYAACNGKKEQYKNTCKILKAYMSVKEETPIYAKKLSTH